MSIAHHFKSLHFDLDLNSNQLVTTESLDFEEYESYTLNVVVSDGVFADSLVVRVDVMDSNDNSPMFNDTEYNFEVEENLSNDTLVGTVMVGYRYYYHDS